MNNEKLIAQLQTAIDESRKTSELKRILDMTNKREDIAALRNCVSDLNDEFTDYLMILESIIADNAAMEKENAAYEKDNVRRSELSYKQYKDNESLRHRLDEIAGLVRNERPRGEAFIIHLLNKIERIAKGEDNEKNISY